MDTNKHESSDGLIKSVEINFEARITALMGPLRGYIASMLGTVDGVDDVLQETNFFLWDRRGDYEVGTSFKAWAYRVAYFKTLAARRDRMREGRHVFSEEFIERIAQKTEEIDDHGDRLGALQQCLEKLRVQDRRLLRLKYVDQKSLTDYSKVMRVSAASVHKTISRLRLALRHCIEKEMRSL